MIVALAQINPILGDFNYNFLKMIEAIKSAQKNGIDLVVFPEASLFGYHPVDLLERPSVVENQLKYISKIQKKIPKGMAVLIGAMTPNVLKSGKPFYNSALFIEAGKKPKVFPKELLPTYDVFDEARHIEPGDLSKNIVKWKGKRFLITICEDIWAWPYKRGEKLSLYSRNPLKKLKGEKLDFIVNLSASPFTVKKFEQRQTVVRKTAEYFNAPMIYVNMVGAQDELIFDGGSFACSPRGEILLQADRFKEDFRWIDLNGPFKKVQIKKLSKDHIRFEALKLGLKDFLRKTGFTKVHLGLSGGIDSAVVAAIAAEAIGGENLHCIGMPGPFNSPESLLWAKQLASNVGAHWYEAPIEKIYDSTIKTMQDSFGDFEFGLTNENAQARARCLLLMGFSNKNSSLLLNPSNKSEFAMGYTTLYGDLTGGLSVIGDLLKTEVYELARFINRDQEIIPTEIIEREPSAELRPNQKDIDNLPPYEELDKVVDKLVNRCGKATSPLEKRVLRCLMRSEFKRWQSPPVLKVSDHSFGRGRRLPVAHRALL